jgi:hypothetical protein
MKIENISVNGFEAALRGMRNPMNSWGHSDSAQIMGFYEDSFDSNIKKIYNLYENPDFTFEEFKRNGLFNTVNFLMGYFIGPNDMDLARRLVKSGSEHRKFLRQINVSMDITAPIYFWKEMDTYKLSTTSNSTSTMHKLASTPVTLDCFEIEDYEPRLDLIDDANLGMRIESFINDLEQLRQRFNETGDKRYWRELVRWLPESWLQVRTWSANYEVLRNIYHQRKGHKLSEWKFFCDTIANELPYAKQFIID